MPYGEKKGRYFSEDHQEDRKEKEGRKKEKEWQNLLMKKYQ
jgi:hypothetical protein